MTTTFLIEHGDVVISETGGQAKLVADAVKLRQDLKEMLSTAVRRGNIGAGLESILDGRPADAVIVRAQLTQRIRSSLANMRKLQDEFHRTERPATELIRQLTLVQVNQLEGGLTDYAFRVEVSTVHGNTSTITGGIS